MKNNTNILITGITGFVGKYLARYLVKQNSEINIFGTYVDEKEYLSFANEFKKVRIFKCDITDDLEADKVIKKSTPDYVYHLAAMSSGNESDRKKVFKVNVDGTVNILRFCQALSKKTRIMLASTSYIYGSSKNCRPFTENDAENPVGIYAESKLEMERVAKKYITDQVEIIISRAFNHTGPGQTENFVVPAFAKQIAEIEKGIKQPVIQVGNLNAVRDFLDVRDVIRAYHLLATEGKSGEIYNLASGKHYSIAEILELLLSLSEIKIKIKKDSSRMRPSDIACSVGSFSKINKELGWSPEIDFKDTLKLTLDYWRSKI